MIFIRPKFPIPNSDMIEMPFFAEYFVISIAKLSITFEKSNRLLYTGNLDAWPFALQLDWPTIEAWVIENRRTFEMFFFY